MPDVDVIKRRRWRRWLRVMLPLNAVGTFVAYLFMIAEVESVIASGPLLFSAGLVTIFGARAMGFGLGTVLGTAQLGICILFVSLVNILRWSPSEAERPFTLMGTAYVMGFLPAAVAATFKVPEVRTFGQCSQCGYMLYGLTEPRCPECGRAFDPGMLPALAQTPAETETAADS